MKPHLNIQANWFPFFDGGFYLTADWRMLMFRVSIGFLDFRIWWDSMSFGKAKPTTQPMPPMLSVACVSCGDVASIVGASRDDVSEQASEMGWAIDSSGAGWSFCQHCKADAKPSEAVIGMIMRRYGMKSVEALNPGLRDRLTSV